MTVLESPLQSVSTEETFASELAEHLTLLRTALSTLLAQWGSPRTASALNTLSGAGQKICWQVFRIVFADDLVAEARNTPTPSSLKRLLAAATEAGVTATTIQAIQEAAEAFQAFSKQSASDRPSFDSLLAGVTSDESIEKIQMSQRRAAYRSMSHIWGIQNDLQLSSAIARRSPAGTSTDIVAFSVQQGIRRLRPDSQVTLYGYHPNPSATQGVTQTEGAIDAAAVERYGMPVLSQFSTAPLPDIEKVVEPGGMVMFNTVGREIGPRGTLDCAFGRIVRDQPFMTDTDGRRLFHQTFVHTRKPVGLLVQELMVHRPSFPNVRPEVMVYQYQLGSLTQEAVRRAMPFPVDERLAMVGRADRVGLADMPQYAEMMRLGAIAAGWDLSEFDVYRVRMPYPIMFSAVRIFFYVD